MPTDEEWNGYGEALAEMQIEYQELKTLLEFWEHEKESVERFIAETKKKMAEIEKNYPMGREEDANTPTPF